MKKSDLFVLFCCFWMSMFCAVTAKDAAASSEDFAGHDAVILEAKGVFDHMFHQELSKEIVSYKIKFLTEKGIEDFGNTTIVYDPATENISSIEGSVTLPDGKVTKLTKSDYFRKKVMKSGRRKRTEIKVVFPGLEPGAIVDFSYHRSMEILDVLSEWAFQGELFTVHSEVAFTPWKGELWGYTIRNAIAEPDIKETRPGGNQTYTITRKNIPALKKENHSAAYRSLRESISFYYENSRKDYKAYWEKEVARIYKKYIRPFTKPCTPSQKIVSEHFQTTPYATNEDLIMAIYDYVIQNYVSLDMMSKKEAEDFDDSYRKKLLKSKDAGDLFSFKYVTDWQASYILASLLQSAVPAATVELGLYVPWDKGLYDPYLKSLKQFDERVVKVTCDGKTYWLSPNKRYMPAGMTEWSSKGVNVLVLNDKTATIEKFPLDQSTDNTATFKTQVSFEPEEGYAVIKRTSEYNRYDSYDWRAALMYLTPEEQKDLIEEEMKDSFGDETTLLNYSIENLEKLSLPLIMEWEVRFPYEFEMAGDQILVDFPGFSIPRTNPFIADTRHSNVFFNFPYVNSTEVTYIIPEGYKVRSVPKNSRINKDILIYNIEYKKVSDNEVLVKISETLKGNMLKKEAAEFFKKTYNDILELRRNKLVLTEV